LTKLLNQYHLAKDDIHGAKFQNVAPLSIEDRTVVRPEIVCELRSRNTDHLDSREINDIECRALAMLRDRSLLNSARNSRKSNKSNQTQQTKYKAKRTAVQCREGEKEEARGLQAGKEEEQEKHDSQHRVQGKAGPGRR